MITNLNELFQDIESRIGRKLAQAERSVIRAEAVVDVIPQGKKMEDFAKSVADRTFRSGMKTLIF